MKKNKDKYTCDSRAAKCGNVLTFKDPRVINHYEYICKIIMW